MTGRRQRLLPQQGVDVLQGASAARSYGEGVPASPSDVSHDGPSCLQGEWGLDWAREVAERHLAGMGDRWLHVQGAGRLGERVEQTGQVSPGFAAAVWLHDVGYAPGLVDSGFHPLDGARWLQSQGAPDLVVGLVAWHTGAQFEAEERGLGAQLETMPRPAPADLDAMTLVDLSVGPSGARVAPDDRLREVLERYPQGHPVHLAITAASPSLLQSANSARRRLGGPAA